MTYMADLHILTLYAGQEIKKAVIFFIFFCLICTVRLTLSLGATERLIGKSWLVKSLVFIS